jgi:stage III sporulation protein SpoIIIAA
MGVGVGKTTAIRELARYLADEMKKRVVLVDTSNEIGGDGDIPHAGVGSSRRMQVKNTFEQHKVMIEAVEVSLGFSSYSYIWSSESTSRFWCLNVCSMQ